MLYFLNKIHYFCFLIDLRNPLAQIAFTAFPLVVFTPGRGIALTYVNSMIEAK